jgi:hypothetical protein
MGEYQHIFHPSPAANRLCFKCLSRDTQCDRTWSWAAVGWIEPHCRDLAGHLRCQLCDCAPCGRGVRPCRQAHGALQLARPCHKSGCLHTVCMWGKPTLKGTASRQPETWQCPGGRCAVVAGYQIQVSACLYTLLSTAVRSSNWRGGCISSAGAAAAGYRSDNSKYWLCTWCSCVIVHPAAGVNLCRQAHGALQLARPCHKSGCLHTVCMRGKATLKGTASRQTEQQQLATAVTTAGAGYAPGAAVWLCILRPGQASADKPTGPCSRRGAAISLGAVTQFACGERLRSRKTASRQMTVMRGSASYGSAQMMCK